MRRPPLAALLALLVPLAAAAREPAPPPPGPPESSAPGPLSPEQEAALALVWHVALDDGCRPLAALHPSPRNTLPPGDPYSLVLDLAAADPQVRVRRISIPDSNEPVRQRNLQYLVVTTRRLPLPVKLYPTFLACRTYLQEDRRRARLPPLPPQNPLQAG